MARISRASVSWVVCPFLVVAVMRMLREVGLLLRAERTSPVKSLPRR